jgi:protein-disulfide isomerase
MMSYQQYFRAILLVLATTTVGCSAQTTNSSNANPATPGQASLADLSADTRSKIEAHLRKKFQKIPADVQFTYGERKPSDLVGYDKLPITLANAEGKSTLMFLISKDNNTLMIDPEKIDVSKMPQAPKIDVTARPLRGNPDAKVTVITFDDFQCPYCTMMHETVFPEIYKQYKDKVKFIYKDYPLSNHPWSMRAAVDANCLNEQKNDAFWDFADYVHGNQRVVTANDKGEKRPLVEQQSKLDSIAAEQAKKNGLDVSKLNACIAKDNETGIKASVKEGDDLGVDSTPTMFVNGEKMSGAIPADAFRAILDRALKAQGVEAPPAVTAEAQPAEKKQIEIKK